MALYPLSTQCYKDNLLLLFDETEEDKNKTKIFLHSSGNGVYYEKWGHMDSITCWQIHVLPKSAFNATLSSDTT